MIQIRPENPDDIEAIRQVHLSAFPRPNEAKLVDLLRQAGKASVSLVALEEGRVIGHVLFSPIDLVPNSMNLHGLGMGPVGVLPKFQRQGIGSRLIIEGLEICRRKGFDFIVELGEPKYYSRFGFLRASDYNLKNEYDADDAFRVIEMHIGILQKISGLVKYQPEFSETDC
ncbi:MAG: N-acetyltransferase [Candidatus Bathyarchaeia archaeon]|jgi:putative acetyltransferase